MPAQVPTKNIEAASICDVLEMRAMHSGDQIFLTYDNDTYTFTQAKQHSCGFANYLLRNVIGDNTGRVTCYLSNRPEYLWSWFGAGYAGMIFVGIHRSHQGEILQDMLSRSRADILVTETEALSEIDLEKSNFKTVIVVDADTHQVRHGVNLIPWPAYTDSDCELDKIDTSSGDISAVLYSSGSTGRSKAVMLPHGQFVAGGDAVATALSLSEKDCIHAWPPLSHIGGMLDITMAALIGGARVALKKRFSASRFWQEIVSDEATVFIGFTNILQILLKSDPGGLLEHSKLRAGLIGYVPPDLREPFEQAFGAKLFDIYGMTEAEPIAFPTDPWTLPEASCGKANPAFDVRIVDENDTPVAPGEIGELVIRERRPHVMFKGYEDDPEATADAWRNGWFHTGDLASCDAEGYIYYKDRKKQIIRRGGENISTWELEMLIERHPAVEECVAIGIPTDHGDDQIKIVVVLGTRDGVPALELKAWCKKNMAKFMVPRYFEFVSEIPQTDTGKPLRKELKYLDERVIDTEAA